MSKCAINSHLSEINLIGRDLVAPKNLSMFELKSLLWTAIDLKYLSKRKYYNENLKNGKDKNITLVIDKPCMFTQLPLKHASRALNAHLNIYMDSDWNDWSKMRDFGRSIAIFSDLIFCKGKYQNKIEEFADISCPPVLGIKSSDYDIITVLSHLMTLQLHYNHLKGLKFAWIGKVCPLFNTYLGLFPKFGIDLKYYCGHSNLQTPVLLESIRCCQRSNTQIQECSNTIEAIYRSDVIATSGHDDPDMCIKMRDIKEAAIDWVLLHDLPRGEQEVEKDVFDHKNSLAWKYLENVHWIYTAIILRFLSSYNHSTKIPEFDDIEAGLTKI